MRRHMRRGGGKETVSDKAKRKIDWLQFGQFLTMIVGLWTMVKAEFKNRKIGPEILEWINGPGRAFFQNECLPTLSEEYLRYLEREKQKNLPFVKPQSLVAGVNLDVDPVAPFSGAILTRNQKPGKVRVEYRPDEDELYVNGKKFVGWLSDEQLTGGVIGGKALQPEAVKHDPCNAAFADWLEKNQEFIPKKCCGKIWYFWASEWSGSVGSCYVRYLYWIGGRWNRGYSRLDNDDWSAREPSASLEN